MNLRVDLILESEQRSPSVVSLKLLKRLSIIVAPALLIFVAILSLLGTMRMGLKLSSLEAEWQTLDLQKEAAQARNAEIARNAAILKALDSWPATKLTLHDQLASLMRMTPETIQIMQLSYDQTITQTGRDLGRATALRMQGRARGEEAENNILLMEKRFGKEEPFATLLNSVSMRGFGDSSAGALPTDRIFTLECEYHPRKFLP